MITQEATTQEHWKSIWHLTYKIYLENDYCKPNDEQELHHFHQLDQIPETTAYIVNDNDGNILGTNSLTVDGPKKLHVDIDFPIETETIRQFCNFMDFKLGASWRIITSCQTRMSVVKELFKATINGILENDLDVVLFDFNPKHEKIYKKLLGLHTLSIKHCPSVNAPGVLMVGHTKKLEHKWKRFLK